MKLFILKDYLRKKLDFETIFCKEVKRYKDYKMVKETIETVLESMISLSNTNYKAVSIKEIAEEVCLEPGQVAAPLNMLVDLGLIIKSKSDNDFLYSLIKAPKAIHLAKVAQLGVNLQSFNHFFKIDEKEKELALAMSTNSEKMRGLDVSKRKALIQKRAYFNMNKTDEVSENLIILLEVANNTLYEYLENLAKKDPELELLMTMHAQAESSCHKYIEGLK